MRVLKWFLAVVAVVLVAFSIFLVNLIWFRPWSLNLFYEKVFAEFLFDEPETLSAIGLVEQFGITGHNGKLSDVSPAHQQQQFERWKKDLAQLREYPLQRQTDSQRLSTHVGRTAFLFQGITIAQGRPTLLPPRSTKAEQ